MNPRMFGSLGRAVLDVGPSDFLVGFAGTSFLMRFASGVATDTLWLAHRLRRGPPMMDFGSAQTPMGLDLVNKISVMGLLSRDEDGNVITVHQEADMDGRQLANVRLYVATAAADGSRQCPDTLIPTSGIGTPRAKLSGSRLFVLDQRIRASSGTDPQRNVTTVVRRFAVDPVNCTGQVVIESAGTPLATGLVRSIERVGDQSFLRGFRVVAPHCLTPPDAQAILPWWLAAGSREPRRDVKEKGRKQ